MLYIEVGFIASGPAAVHGYAILYILLILLGGDQMEVAFVNPLYTKQ